MTDRPVERIGLLFVHGIGEQRRFEHLANSVAELAELIDRADARACVSLVDRTPGWTLPPGEQDPAGTAPITLSVRSPELAIDYDCHEVWWADLGTRAGLGDLIRFWLWGLGQWAAPIYRDIDASRLDKDAQDKKKPVPSLARLPRGIVGQLAQEPWARMRLLAAALAAAFTAVTWSLLKRLAGGLTGQAPGPTLIVRYVGDVRTYTEPGMPGRGATTDPGQPRRVAIRRRMVREMVAMAAKPLDGWYVLAHSLGTVVAYNGLTEIGHTLPNYLTEAEWRALPDEFRRDPGCALRRDLENMMPSRPAWLDDGDVINRPALFRTLRGLLTYGSPLGKFASLWPRIVATATDRRDGRRPFPPDCRWLNLAAPQDPVAGMLGCFPTGKGDPLEGAIPAVVNVRTPLGRDLGQAHTRYLQPVERYAAGLGVTQKCMVARWLLGQPPIFEDAPFTPAGRLALAAGDVGTLLLLLASTALAVAGMRAVVGTATPEGLAGWAVAAAFLEAAARGAGPVLGTGLALVTLAGVGRWSGESRYNIALAVADRDADSGQLHDYWCKVIRMLERHRATAVAFVLLGWLLLVPALLLDWWTALHPGGWAAGHPWLPRAAGVSLMLAAVASIAQTMVNKMVPAADRYEP